MKRSVLIKKQWAISLAILTVLISVSCMPLPYESVHESPIPSLLTPSSISDEAYLLSLAKTDKKAALSMALSMAGNAIYEDDAEHTLSYEEVPDIWWNILMDVDGISQQFLTDEEIKMLPVLAYLLDQTDCFLFTDGLSKDEILDPLEAYYGSTIWAHMYSMLGGMELGCFQALPPDNQPDHESSMISADKANMFIRFVLGTDIPHRYEEFDHKNGVIQCRDGMYRIEDTDLLVADLLVSEYRYLGDDLYYVAFDGDDWYLDGADEDKSGIIPDYMKLIVEKSSAPWGFTCVAKVSSLRCSVMKEGWMFPEDTIFITNSSGKDLPENNKELR